MVVFLSDLWYSLALLVRHQRSTYQTQPQVSNRKRQLSSNPSISYPNHQFSTESVSKGHMALQHINTLVLRLASACGQAPRTGPFFLRGSATFFPLRSPQSINLARGFSTPEVWWGG